MTKVHPGAACRKEKEEMNIRRGRFSSVLEFISHQKVKEKGMKMLIIVYHLLPKDVDGNIIYLTQSVSSI